MRPLTLSGVALCSLASCFPLPLNVRVGIDAPQAFLDAAERGPVRRTGAPPKTQKIELGSAVAERFHYESSGSETRLVDVAKKASLLEAVGVATGDAARATGGEGSNAEKVANAAATAGAALELLSKVTRDESETGTVSFLLTSDGTKVAVACSTNAMTDHTVLNSVAKATLGCLLVAGGTQGWGLRLASLHGGGHKSEVKGRLDAVTHDDQSLTLENRRVYGHGQHILNGGIVALRGSTIVGAMELPTASPQPQVYVARSERPEMRAVLLAAFAAISSVDLPGSGPEPEEKR